MRSALSCTLMILLASALVRSQTTTPAATPATTQGSQPAADPAAKKILDALEAAGGRNKTIRSDLNYEVKNPSLDSTETRTGYVLYQKNDPKDFTRFRVHFDTLQQSDGDQAGPRILEKKDYAFGPDKDGTQWMSIKEFANKKLILRQVAPADKIVEPLQIGEGPFPLPFGQKTKDVLKCCDVSTRPAKADDPKGTDYIRLVPKPDYRNKLNFAVMEMWVDRELGLPIKIVSTEHNKTATTVIFLIDEKHKIEINKPMKPDDFKLDRPVGWTVESKPLE